MNIFIVSKLFSAGVTTIPLAGGPVFQPYPQTFGTGYQTTGVASFNLQRQPTVITINQPYPGNISNNNNLVNPHINDEPPRYDNFANQAATINVEGEHPMPTLPASALPPTSAKY